MTDRDALVARLRDYARRIDGLPSESDLAPMQVAQLIYDAADALSRETARYPHWTCRTHGDFDARVAVGCPECVREMRTGLKARETAAPYGSEVLCPDCARVFCPSGERLHFHHDGCPACDAEELAQEPIQYIAVAGSTERRTIEVYDPLAREAQETAGTCATWQPIASAPKNQVVLVYYVNQLGNGRIVRAEYVEAMTREVEMEGGVYDEAKDAYFLPEGWYEDVVNSDHCDYAHDMEATPTHWMPLPASPAKETPD